MFSTLLTVALFVAPAIQGVFADFAINSPDLVQCKSSKISWEPTKGPYNLIVVKASDPCGDALVEIGDFTDTFVEWTAGIPSGTDVLLSLVDAADNEAWSNKITVGPNSDASCLSAAFVSPPAAAGSSPAATTSNTSSTGGGSSGGDSSGAASSGDSDTSDPVPVGAVNAGSNPLKDTSAALTARQASIPLMVIAGLAATLLSL